MSFQKSLWVYLGVCLGVSSSFCSSPLYASEHAQSEHAQSEAQAQVEYLLQQPLTLSSPQLKTMANSLSLSEKIELYKNYKKEDVVGYVFLNTLSPIALGSFVQGDTEGAWFSTGLGVGGLLLSGVGGSLISSGIGSSNHTALGAAYTVPGLLTGALGLGLLSWAFVERIQSPQQFNQQYNQTLWNQLSLTPTETGVEVGLGF